MPLPRRSLLITAPALVGLFARVEAAAQGFLEELEYMGQRFRLSKRYATYEAYRDDPSNLRPEDLATIERIMTSTSVGPTFVSESAFGDAVSKLKFPGYGSASLRVDSAQGERWKLIGLEIPQAHRTRYVLAQVLPRDVVVRDSFVLAEPAVIVGARIVGGRIQYLGLDSSLLREQTL